MTLNWIWLWDSCNAVALGNAEYSFIAITPWSTEARSSSSSYGSNIDSFLNYSYSIEILRAILVLWVEGSAMVRETRVQNQVKLYQRLKNGT